SQPLQSGQPFQFNATASGLVVGDGPFLSGLEGSAPRQLALEVGSLEPARITISTAGQAYSVDLVPGLTRYTLNGVDVPANVSISVDRPAGTGVVFLRSIGLISSGSNDPGSAASLHSDVLVAQPAVSIQGASAHLDLRTAGAREYSDGMWAGATIIGTATTGAWRSLGWWGFSVANPDVQFDLDLRTDQAKASTASGELPLSRALQPSED